MADIKKTENYLLRAIRVGFYFLLLTPFIISRGAFYPFVHGKVFYFLAVGEIIIWLYFTLCLVNKSYRPKLRGINLAAFLFLAALFITSFFGVNFERSFWGTWPKMLGLFEIAHIFLLFLALGALFRDEIWRKKFLFFVFLSGAGLAVLGVIQSIYPSFLETGWGGLRIGTTFDNPDYYASIVIFPLFFGIYLFLQADFKKKIYYLAGIFLIAYNLLFTGARGALVAGIAGIVLIVCFYLFKRGLERKQILKRILFVVVLIFLIVLAVYFFGSVTGRFSWVSIRYAFLESGRTYTWQAAIRGFLARPVLGWGFNNFNALYNKFYEAEMLRLSYAETLFDSSHNILLDYLTAGGVIVFAAFLYLLYGVWRQYRRVDEKNKNLAVILCVLLVIYLAQGLFIFDTLVSFFLFFVVLAVPASFAADSGPAICAKNNFWRVSSLLVLIFLVFVFRGTVINWARASYALGAADNKFKIGDAPAAVHEFEMALTSAGPFREEIVAKYAADFNSFVVSNRDWEARLGRKKVDEVFDALLAAAEKYPYDSRYPILAGNLGIILGEKDSAAALKAKEALQNHFAVTRERQMVYYHLIRLNMLLNNPDEAEKLAREVVALDDRISDSHFYLSMVLFWMGDDADGFAELERAKELGYSVEDPSAMLMAATYWGNKGDFRRVESILKRATDFLPSGQLYAMLAATQAKLGEKSEAIKSVEYAVHLEPSLRAEAREFLKSVGIKVMAE